MNLLRLKFGWECASHHKPQQQQQQQQLRQLCISNIASNWILYFRIVILQCIIRDKITMHAMKPMNLLVHFYISPTHYVMNWQFLYFFLLAFTILDSSSFHSFQECSIFLFEKRCAEKLHKPKRKEAVTEILRNSVKQLERFRHPKVMYTRHTHIHPH